MSNRDNTIIGFAFMALAAFALWPRRVDAYVPSINPVSPNEDDFLYPIPEVIIDETPYDWPVINDDLPTGYLFPIPDIVFEDDEVSKINAFLYAVRRSEHSFDNVASGLDYFTFFGDTYFSGTNDHPVLTGEKVGIRLPDAWCLAAGFKPGCVSTAAGAYQAIVPTWNRIRAKAPRIPDFSRESQDEFARRLLVERGADKLISAGKIQEAMYVMSPIWASLPFSKSGQPKRSVDEVMAFYSAGLNAQA